MLTFCRQLGRRPVNAAKKFADFRKKLEKELERRLLSDGLIFANLRKYIDDLEWYVVLGRLLLCLFSRVWQAC